jgi:ABC-type cobalt transport system substrate-binding protein
MGARALRKEFSREAAQIVAREMVKVRDQLARSPAFQSLGKLEQKAMLERTGKAMERAYYEKAGAFFEREAKRSEAIAAKYAGANDKAGKHIHQLTTENAAAYRQMAEAARLPKRLLPGLKIGDKQFGKKVGKHAEDFGLDPGNPSHRQQVRERIETIVGKYDEVRQGAWNPRRGGGSDFLFYRQGADVVVTKLNGDFVTVLPGGQANGWFHGASPL